MNQPQNLSPLGQIKARARFVSLHSLWSILPALAIQYVLGYLFSIVLSLADYQFFGNSTEVTLSGMTFSVTYEVTNILTQFVIAPLSLGIVSYIQKLGRGLPSSFGEIFSWLGDGEKRKMALIYAVWRIFFLTVTFPLRVLPLNYLSDRLSQFMQEMTESMSLTGTSMTLATREVYIALIVLLIYGLVSLPFMALPYILTDQSRFGFFKCFRWSLHIMMDHLPHFLFFLISFIPFMLFASCLIVLFIFLVVYFQVALAIFMDSIRRGEISPAYNRGERE